MRELPVIMRPTPSPWLSNSHIRSKVHPYFRAIQGFHGWNMENKGGKKLHWGGVEPPPLALRWILEGKDDNRFTTSVLRVSWDSSVSRDSEPIRRLVSCVSGFPPRAQYVAIYSEGCGMELVRIVARPVAQSTDQRAHCQWITMDRKGKRPVSHPRHLRHVHTTLWQGRSSCRQKLHKGLL